MWAGSRQAAGYTAASGGGSGFIPNATLGVTYTGSPANGGVMSFHVPGGGMGARSRATPLFLWMMGEDGGTTFATHALSATSKTLTPNNANGPNTVIQSSVAPVNALGACQYLPNMFTGATHAPTAFTDQPIATLPGGAGNWLYTFIKRNWAFSQAPDNDKPWRFWSSGGGRGLFNYPNCYIAWVGPNSGNGANDWVGESELSNTFSGLASHFVSMGTTINAWVTDEVWFQENTFNVTDGIMNWARNGKLGYELTGRWQTTNTSDGPGPVTNLFLDEVSPQTGGSGTPNGTSDFGYLGIVLADDSPLQAIITDEGATYQTAQVGHGAVDVHREIQIQTVRTDTDLTLGYMRQGSHASFSGKNLLVPTGYGTAMNLGVFA